MRLEKVFRHYDIKLEKGSVKSEKEQPDKKMETRMNFLIYSS